jgi:hypothetical protein
MLPPRRHSFTHFHLDIDAALLHLANNRVRSSAINSAATPTRLGDEPAAAWVDPGAPGDLGLPAPIARLLADASRQLQGGAADDASHDNGEPQ